MSATLLDTSALLAVCLQEPGFEIADAALAAGDGWVAAPTWLEVRIQLDRAGQSAQQLLDLYAAVVAGTIDITKEVAGAAYEIRTATRGRIPAVDCLIAGAARFHGMTLVHRDRHMAAIPAHLLQQTMLPTR